MSWFYQAVLFAVILAINLFLLGAVLAGGLALTFKFTENVSARVRYVISVIVFLLAVLLPLAAALNAPSISELISLPVDQIKQENKVEIFATPNAALVRAESGSNRTDEPVNSSAGYLNQVIISITVSPLGTVFFGLWMLGLIFFFFRELIEFWRLKQTRRLWTPATDSEKETLLCPKAVPLYFDEYQSPGTIGFLRPAVVLPKQFPAGLSLDSKRLIVQHELAHARGRDPLVSFLLRTIRALFWISPWLWLIEHLINSEREAAADRAAIDFLSNESEFETVTLSYADTLLTIAKTFNSFRNQSRKSQAVGIGSGSELETRVRRLLSSSQTTGLQTASAITACVLTATAMLFIPVAAFSGFSKNSLPELQQSVVETQIEVKNFNAINNSNPIAESSSNEDAESAGAEGSQQPGYRSKSLKSWPALNSSNESLKISGNPQPATELKNDWQNGDELKPQKTAVESASSPGQAVAPKLKPVISRYTSYVSTYIPYVSMYIPYPASKGSQ